MERKIGLPEMLNARDYRVLRQQALLEQYHLSLVSFTMNIPGPVKNSPLIRRGFRLGKKLLLAQLERTKIACVFEEEADKPTGCEGLYVVRADPVTIKEMTRDLEEGTGLGRLFDFDVLAPDGTKLDRPVPRRCLICGRPAKECARSRAHPLPELQARTQELLEGTLAQHDTETAAGLAVRALLYEVCITPKPGLVDRANNGSHQDMDVFTFLTSASSLWPYFAECVRTGRRTASRPAGDTFAALRWPGKLAEGTMLTVTKGVNTHKGAIFSMGLLCGALGRMERSHWNCPEEVLAEISAMTKSTVERELDCLTADSAQTAGQRFYLQYGVSGIRGQAAEGFPTVLKVGLPILEEGLSQGKTFDEAGAAALLALLAYTVDTNMIARGGLDTQRRTSLELAKLLQKTAYPNRETLDTLDQSFIQQNLSPGGSADLLALCCMLHFLREEGDV